jgi:hypothetical protein
MRNNTSPKKREIFIFLCIMVLFLSPNLISRICSNGSGYGFCDPDCETESGCNNAIINYYIELGAGYFLNSYSNTLVFLNRIELENFKGIDYLELNQILNDAVRNIKTAKEVYSLLIRTAEITPYNKKIIFKLRTFDYSAFSKENGLNDVVFREVADFLKAGDIIGVYKWFHLNLNEIEAMLILMSNEVSSNRIPLSDNLWRVNEEYSRTLLFSQYVAMVFDAILQEV